MIVMIAKLTHIIMMTLIVTNATISIIDPFAPFPTVAIIALFATVVTIATVILIVIIVPMFFTYILMTTVILMTPIVILIAQMTNKVMIFNVNFMMISMFRMSFIMMMTLFIRQRYTSFL